MTVRLARRSADEVAVSAAHSDLLSRLRARIHSSWIRAARPTDTGAGKQSPDAGTEGKLGSLAPRFVEEQHGTYLRHLDEQVSNPKNLNIALTGRYGAGKSSVLDEFERKRKSDTVRLGIAALDPSSDEKNLTNRIQKELVKQLLYRAPPKVLRHSRYGRIVPLTWGKALSQSAVLVLLAGAVLAFLGWLPAVAGTGHDHGLWLRVGSWVGFGALGTVVLALLRLTILERREVSDLSAAGATITLRLRETTYFDEYLDEIVHFFDTAMPRHVLFEDLDRFDDPHIFEALRELNTLLNNTDARRKAGVPLHFIYAVKDSLFEKLGADTREARGDVVDAETVRANRTKFFEVVIPVVPFISHRNARELLQDILDEREIELDRDLVDLVARHVPEMRLLRNICNEYEIFAARLLRGDKIAPGLTRSLLFALVTYKNFHLKDFEQISRRKSDLDRLYGASRRLVADAVQSRQREWRSLKNGEALTQAHQKLAAKLGDRLLVVARSAANAAIGSGASGLTLSQIITDTAHSLDDAGSVELWRSVVDKRELRVLGTRPGYGEHVLAILDFEQLGALFPEAFNRLRWSKINGRTVADRIATLDAEIACLRGADFADLARNDSFRFTLDEEGEADRLGYAVGASLAFTELLDATLKSELSRELVKEGYIDRNFSLYSAQFYGHFSGVDVATFLVQNVYPNTMDIHYEFESPTSIQNLLTESPAGFTRTVAALNIPIVDELLATDDPRIEGILDLLMHPSGPEPRQFLQAFLNADLAPERLVAALARRGWKDVLQYVVSDDGVPDDRRVSYVDAALNALNGTANYRLDAAVCGFIVEHYAAMVAFVRRQDLKSARLLAERMDAAEIMIPELDPVASPLCQELVRRRAYALTAPNLRIALDTPDTISLDVARNHEDVYAYCRENPTEYLRAVADDEATPHAILGESALVEILSDLPDEWDEQVLADVLASTSLESRLTDLEDVPEETWQALATARLFRPSLHNISAYHQSVGAIDQPLADLLAGASAIEVGSEDDDETREAIAVAILNARGTIASPEHRVQLAASLELGHPIDPSSITPERGNLLGLLLEHQLVEDARDVFVQFRPAGWQAIESGIAASSSFPEWCDAEIAAGFISQLLASQHVPDTLRAAIVDDLEVFVPDQDAAVLQAVAEYALKARRRLSVVQLNRVADATQDGPTVLSLLALSRASAPEIVDVLGRLPEPYSFFATRAKIEFDVPDDDDHRQILNNLRQAGIVWSHRKRTARSVRAVKLPG